MTAWQDSAAEIRRALEPVKGYPSEAPRSKLSEADTRAEFIGNRFRLLRTR